MKSDQPSGTTVEKDAMTTGRKKVAIWRAFRRSMTVHQRAVMHALHTHVQSGKYRETDLAYNQAALAVMKPNLKEEPDGK